MIVLRGDPPFPKMKKTTTKALTTAKTATERGVCRQRSPILLHSKGGGQSSHQFRRVCYMCIVSGGHTFISIAGVDGRILDEEEKEED